VKQYLLIEINLQFLLIFPEILKDKNYTKVQIYTDAIPIVNANSVIF
jgi:hypothetical protein